MNTCAHCDAALPEYTGRGRRPKYCDKTCSRRAQKAAAKTRPGKPCTENECDHKVVARGLCTMHYKRERRAAGVEPTSSPWTDARRHSYDVRRARKRNATIGPPFTRTQVYQRDGWKCQLCGHLISPDTAWPDPRSASLDHIIPLARGGAHSIENTQLACLQCNVRKSDWVDPAAERAEARAVPDALAPGAMAEAMQAHEHRADQVRRSLAAATRARLRAAYPDRY